MGAPIGTAPRPAEITHLADTLNPPWDPSHVDAMWTQTNKRRDTGRGLT